MLNKVIFPNHPLVQAEIDTFDTETWDLLFVEPGVFSEVWRGLSTVYCSFL
jgi:hypothetical protein